MSVGTGGRIYQCSSPHIEYYCQGQNNDSGGGRGVIILHKIADRLSYTRQGDNRNCLLIVKNYDAEVESLER